MIYFDNAATGGRKPDAVLTAVRAAIRTCANAGRGGHKLALSCLNRVQQCRNALSDHFDGYGFDRVIFTKNCTEALNILLFGTLEKGDHIISSAMEHNSVLRPLQHLKNTRGVSFSLVPLTDGNVTPESVKALLQPNTKAVIITSASNVTGAIPPLKQIRDAIPDETLFFMDGAQGGGHLPIKMQKLGIDGLALAGHKGLFGIQGSGALLFSERVLPAPLLFGGTGTTSFSLDMPDFYPEALEAGTLSFPAVSSLLEGVRYLSVNENRIFKRLIELTDYCLQGLSRLPNFQAYSIPNPCGIVAFKHKSAPSEQIAEQLSTQFNIATRGGLHCAPKMHEALNTLDGGLVRVSFSHFNSETEIDQLFTALKTF